MILVENLVYEYPGKRALDNVSFDLKPKTITALVGPNGAGKTTLIRCLVALTQPFSGKITISGLDTLENPREIHHHLGYLSDFYGFYDELTVEQNLCYFAWSHGIAYQDTQVKVDKAITRLELADYRHQLASTLSRGLKQRLGIAQAIVHEPSLIILDEPASGLDPEARIHLSSLFVELNQAGATLIVSSHILAELEDYCTQMLVMRDGKITDVQQLTNTPSLTYTIKLSEPAALFLEKLGALSDINILSHEDNILTLTYVGTAENQPNLLKQLMALGLPVIEITQVKHRLQDLYLGKKA
jgi:ABC-2 type transport system ATP-binding protein